MAARDLSFEDRIKAQQAIERVYYSHQIGATRPFEEAVPRAVLERKVRTYLKQSVALEKFWKSPVTNEMLRRELERMTRHTRMPQRLREIYAALGNDSLLIQECLVRPILVDRLVRNFFAYDQAMHSEALRSAEVLRDEFVSGRQDPRAKRPNRAVTVLVRRTAPSGERGNRPSGQAADSGRLELEPDDFDKHRAWLPRQAGEIGPVHEEREAFVIRAVLAIREGEISVGSFVLPKQSWEAWWRSVEHLLDDRQVWGVASSHVPIPLPGTDASEVGSASGCVPDDTWDSGTLDDLPEARFQHKAVWTGSHMLVWGGRDAAGLGTGGRYDPATDTWASISRTNAPPPRQFHSTIWTGELMIVWGGYDNGLLFNTGGRYDPLTDSWTPTSDTGAPSARNAHSAVWTGASMVIWGGGDSTSYLNSGGVYDPVSDTWAAASVGNAPSGRLYHAAVWTGNVMLVWGGWSGGDMVHADGGRYDLFADSWAPMSTTNAPSPRGNHTAVWTGREMIVWGGGHDVVLENSGGRYDPTTDSWGSISTEAVPSGRVEHTAVWTGGLMVVWGGSDATGLLDTGGRYDPASDRWTSTATENVPSPRTLHTAIWTGAQMVVWGGISPRTATQPLDSGGRYDPATDSWTPTSRGNAPSARALHTATWTGTHMIVWGGSDESLLEVNTGARYDPSLDSWTPTSLADAPSSRRGHSAVWTGSYVVVWGGESRSPSVVYLGSGGRYDPVTDAWRSTSTASAPSGRARHTAVWTGQLMVVWGGDRGFALGTGGRYDPETDMWMPTSMSDAPSARSYHTAVWAGPLMLVWGGYGSAGYLNSGGRYDPASDTWSITSTMNAPTGRAYATSVWTRSHMLVWGGDDGVSYPTSGGRYNPLDDTWLPTSPVNAPSWRNEHTAVWTGSRMVVWGGSGALDLDTGGLYDPQTDSWEPTSSQGAPSARHAHTAIWTGSLMVVWGGSGASLLRSGGRYALGHSTDDDGDGFSECSGDCNDANAVAYPGAVEICDHLDNDCDGMVDNAPAPIGSLSVGIAFQVSAVVLGWEPLPDATGYDVVRGDLGTLHSSGGNFGSAIEECLANDLEESAVGISEAPAAGNGFWYVVRAVSCGGHGTYDSGGPNQVGSRDVEIDGSVLSCP